ncbi:MAG TPA: hypothetical protein DCG34_10030 [Clostridiales bacterium]|nr:hypothetical protein [Clostridiales bacterium]
MNKLPLNDSIAIAISKMVDDALCDTREPSHSDIEYEFKRAGLLEADPKQKGNPVGKAKRVKAVLYWAIENDQQAGEKLVCYLLNLVRSVGGFRSTSPNFIGEDSIANMIDVFKNEGYSLSEDGSINTVVLENLNSVEKYIALKAYAKRAIKGSEDAALLVGTGKDLMEAVATHIIMEKWGAIQTQTNFPTLLGQTFTALGLATSSDEQQVNEQAQKRVERALYEFACSINKLRNKEGTGHGRPFLTNVTDEEAKVAIEGIGLISEFLLAKMK